MGSFITKDRRERTCACIDFSVDGDLTAGTNVGFAFPHLYDVEMAGIQCRGSSSPLWKSLLLKDILKFNTIFPINRKFKLFNQSGFQGFLAHRAVGKETVQTPPATQKQRPMSSMKSQWPRTVHGQPHHLQI